MYLHNNIDSLVMGLEMIYHYHLPIFLLFYILFNEYVIIIMYYGTIRKIKGNLTKKIYIVHFNNELDIS